jgi:hypothetical protein
VDDLVDVVGGDTGFGGPGCNVQHLTREPADLAHTILLFFCEDLDPVSSDEDLRECQLPICNCRILVFVTRTCSLFGIPCEA